MQPAIGWHAVRAAVAERVGSESVHDPRLPVGAPTSSGPVGWTIQEAVRSGTSRLSRATPRRPICSDCSSAAELDWLAHCIATFDPSHRADQMNYGGHNDSGVGREVEPSAMQERIFVRVLVLTGVTL
jgi:hypothetical protein